MLPFSTKYFVLCIKKPWSSGYGRILVFVPKVVSSIPSPVYWMDISHIHLL